MEIKLIFKNKFYKFTKKSTEDLNIDSSKDLKKVFKKVSEATYYPYPFIFWGFLTNGLKDAYTIQTLLSLLYII